MDPDGADDNGIIIDYADDDVDGMIRAVAAEHPEAARKFLVNTPAMMAKRTSNPAKRKSESDGKAKKKKKKADDSGTDEPPPTITYYIFIPKVLPTTSNKRNTRKVAEEDKYNAEKLALGKADGYKVLITEMEDKAPSGRQVLLYMPAPAKPLEEAPMTFHRPPSTSQNWSRFSLATPSKLKSFNKTTKDERAKLEDKYPIGNNPQHPGIRVYRDSKTGFCWDLTHTCLGIWSSQMAQGHTDENTPPTSKFFDANQRIKTVTPPAVAAPPIVAAPAAPPPPAVSAAGLSLSDLLLATIFSQGGGGGGPLAALLPQLHPAPVAPPPPPPPPLQQSAPPSPVKPHSVLIADFAKTYNLADGDVELLTQVGFRPGDATEASLHEDLKSAGFTFLSWRRIHTANVRFKADLARGTYD
ncbi:hypothetical protein B0H16DRAFT_1826467 [Mycena metata]|uniref:Uncharacterized protein n=1 Tax=Mycena metata TaxID=1033252 RepID=A0AAD7GUZ5_9AGAR|nr:hypothetical protein B0H16DRAFT_1826467 [Mycena metata]